MFDTTLPRDSQSTPIIDTDFALKAEKEVEFAGGTTNDPGDYDGTGNPKTIFTVTGTVVLRLLAVCKTLLVGSSATLEVGITGDTAKIIAQTTAESIDADEVWHDASPDSKIEATSVMAENIVSNNIIQTVGTANITSGKIKYIAMWYPLSKDGKVVPA